MKITPVIESVLEKHPDARSSDKLLLLRVWARLGLDLTPAQRIKFIELPSTESIRRVRQKIQEEGRYVATDRVRRDRSIRSAVIQQNAPQASPERLETLTQESMFS